MIIIFLFVTLTPKSAHPLLSSPPPTPTQPSKLTSPLAINLDPIELLFSTPPTSPQAFLNSLKDLPPATTNPPPPRPSFDTIEHLANEPPPIPPIDSSFPSPTPNMEPPIPPFPPQCSPNLPSNVPPLPRLGHNNSFPMLTHEMFCEHCQRTQVIVDNFQGEVRFDSLESIYTYVFSHISIVKDDEVVIDAILLATKPLVIVEYKIDKDQRMGYFKLIRANRSSKRYSSMIKMLQGIDREDLETLWKLVKAKHENTRLEEDYEKVLWGDLKVMFEPDINSEVRRNLQGYKVTVWKLFDNCGLHFV
ncbi:hypothetical protein Tco_0628827, partial [Tanacetum coccineum]